jgi:hypothetical protein
MLLLTHQFDTEPIKGSECDDITAGMIYLSLFDLVPALNKMLRDVQDDIAVQSHMDLTPPSTQTKEMKDLKLTSCQGIRAVSSIDKVLLA